MQPFQIFGLQFALSLLVYSLLARWYLWPALLAMPLRSALIPLLFFNSIRHLGMTNLVGVVTDPNLPDAFKRPQAYGDLIAMLLAVLCIVALRNRWGLGIYLVWLFNIWGFADLVYALVKGIQLRLYNYHLASFWYTPTFLAPALLVTHVLMFALLVKRSGKGAEAAG